MVGGTGGAGLLARVVQRDNYLFGRYDRAGETLPAVRVHRQRLQPVHVADRLAVLLGGGGFVQCVCERGARGEGRANEGRGARGEGRERNPSPPNPLSHGWANSGRGGIRRVAKLGVVLTSRDTAETIGQVYHALAAQWRRPDMTVLVDDGSQDKTAGVLGGYWDPNDVGPLEVVGLKRGKGAARVCWPSKREGFARLAAAGCQYGVALDTDGDYIPPHYLARLEQVLEDAPGVAVAYPGLVQFGARTGDYLPAEDSLARCNIAPATSMVRLAALEQIGGWPQPFPEYAFCDWAAWRRLRALGWRMQRANTEYFWRRHAGSVSFSSPLHQEQWAQTIDWTDLVTIAVPISGREWCLDALLGSIAGQQDVPQELLRVVLLDNSRNEQVAARLQEWMADQRYGSVHYIADHVGASVDPSPPNPLSHGVPGRGGISNAAVADGDRRAWEGPVNRRVAAVWARIAAAVQTDLVWCLEDDCIPAPYALSRLLARFTGPTDAVSACYFCRRSAQPVVWRYDGHGNAVAAVRTAGLEAVDGCGFGCVLLRRHLLEPLRGGLRAGWYDHDFWRGWRGRARVYVDWDLPVLHAQNEGREKKKRRRGGEG